jgi:hypothetical protein
MIEKLLKDKYVLKSKNGSKNLGTYNTKDKAEEREKQISFFKALKDRENEKRTARHSSKS